MHFVDAVPRLEVPVRYFSRTKALKPSDLRCLAYEDGSPILGPALDPTGWTTVSTQLKGMLFSQREAEINCQVSYVYNRVVFCCSTLEQFAMAYPTDFPRGYPIPFFAIVKSSDQQALDLATSPVGFLVRLERCYTPVPGFLLADARGDHDPGGDFVATGRFWQEDRGFQDSNTEGTRTLQGELPISHLLTPSFSCPSFSLSVRYQSVFHEPLSDQRQYQVSVSIQVTGLNWNRSGRLGARPGLSIPVTITSSAAPGPLPRSYAPSTSPGRPLRDVATSIASQPSIDLDMSFV